MGGKLEISLILIGFQKSDSTLKKIENLLKTKFQILKKKNFSPFGPAIALYIHLYINIFYMCEENYFIDIHFLFRRKLFRVIVK